MPNREVLSQPDRPLGKRYQDLPLSTQYLLENWDYGGIRPPELSVPGARPSLSFMIADIKLPPEGPAKILELGGLGSHLDAYPDGPATVADRIYQILGSLGKPVRVITPLTMGDAFIAMGGGPVGAARTLIGADMNHAETTYGITFPKANNQRKFEAKQAGPVEPLADLRDAKAVLWTHQNPQALASIDTGRVALINPPEVAELIDNKALTQRFFEEHNLTDVRPTSWIIPNTSTRGDIDHIIASAGAIERFVVKPVGLSGGRGVEVHTRERVIERLGDLLANQHKTDDPDDPDFHLTNTLAYGGSLVLEEYVPAKPVEVAGKQYDATMRIAVVTIVNNGKLTVVPVAAYYKLPTQAQEEGWTRESVVSSVLGRDESSARVAPEDFQRAFTSVTRALPDIVQLAHTAPRVAKEPEPVKPKYQQYDFKGDPATDPQEGQEYVLFGRKVRFLGRASLSNGMEGFEVEYLDNEEPESGYRRGHQTEKKEFYGYWQLERLYRLPSEETDEF